MVDAGDPPDLRLVLRDLAGRGVRRLMVEGGTEVHTHFLAQGLADELQLVVAPFFVGDARAPRFVAAASFPETLKLVYAKSNFKDDTGKWYLNALRTRGTNKDNAIARWTQTSVVLRILLHSTRTRRTQNTATIWTASRE